MQKAYGSDDQILLQEEGSTRLPAPPDSVHWVGLEPFTVSKHDHNHSVPLSGKKQHSIHDLVDRELQVVRSIAEVERDKGRLAKVNDPAEVKRIADILHVKAATPRAEVRKDVRRVNEVDDLLAGNRKSSPPDTKEEAKVLAGAVQGAIAASDMAPQLEKQMGMTLAERERTAFLAGHTAGHALALEKAAKPPHCDDGSTANSVVLEELKEQIDRNENLKAMLDASAYMKKAIRPPRPAGTYSEEGLERKEDSVEKEDWGSSLGRNRKTSKAQYCLKARTECPCVKPAAAPKAVQDINFALCKPFGGLNCAPNLGLGTCNKNDPSCSCPDHITPRGSFTFYGVPSTQELLEDVNLKHYSNGFCSPWNGILALTGQVVCAPRPYKKGKYKGRASKKFWCTQMLVSNPYGAAKNIGVLSMKRVACIENHCEVIKRSRCFKCKEDIYGTNNMDDDGNSEIDVTARNRRMANCALKIMEAEERGVKDPTAQCTGADASYALMVALTQ